MFKKCFLDFGISIHALRVEGDEIIPLRRLVCAVISIHALRVEGDAQCSRIAGSTS